MLRKKRKAKSARALTAAFEAPFDDEEEDELPFHSSPDAVDQLKFN
jgi:hypothetical protein